MEILYQDSFLAVVVKPRGFLSEGEEKESVPVALAPICGTLYPVHRLDRAVGGVMVYAKDKKTAAFLSSAVAEGKLYKEYAAVAEGELPEKGEFTDLLYHDVRQNKTFVATTPRKGAKEARLFFEKEGSVGGFSLLKVLLQTGRSHQIRVQFGSRKHPLVGDGKYGSKEKAAGPALFARRLKFPHPDGREMDFFAPLPKEFPFDLFEGGSFEIERKFLIAYPDTAALQKAGATKWEIVQTYLKAEPGETLRVRRVLCQGSETFFQTRKLRVSAIRAVEEEKEISALEYAVALQKADERLHPIEKVRYRLLFENHLIEVDVYPFWQDRAVAEVELLSEEESFSFPPAVRVLREITEDKRYKNVNLAKEVPFDEI